MPLSEITIGETLKGIGYNTFFARKWHLGNDSLYWPKNQGFYPNGIWTAPSDQALKADIQRAMKVGFNGARCDSVSPAKLEKAWKGYSHQAPELVEPYAGQPMNTGERFGYPVMRIRNRATMAGHSRATRNRSNRLLIVLKRYPLGY